MRSSKLAPWAAAVLALLACCSYLSPLNKARFDPAAWNGPDREDEHGRCAMIDDLRRKVLRHGEHIARVKAVLGEPDAPGSDGVVKYYLGYCTTSVDPDTLDIAHDADGRITSIDVVTH